MKGVSVIVCCYNSAARLAETLKYLSLQKVPDFIPWEIIIVDNASKDNTGKIAFLEWARLNKNDIKFRIVNQPVPGLSFARAKGVEESTYDYLVFCDDDNWLFEDYIEEAYNLLNAWPQAAIIGGIGFPKADIAFPEWFKNYGPYYAIGRQNTENGLLQGNSPYVYGAGAVIRKSVFQQLKDMQFEPLATDRLNEKLSSGGDVELCYVVNLLGHKIGYSEGLKFYHFIQRNRLTDKYLLALVYQFGYCNILHRPYFWLFNPNLPNYKKTWLWTLLISINIYLISLIKYLSPSKPTDKIVNKVNLKQSTGRLMAIIKLNNSIEKYYLMISQKFKYLAQATN